MEAFFMLRMVLMGDLHYPSMENPSEEFLEMRERFYTRFLQRFLEVEADYHISLGDLTNQGVAEELEYVFSHINESNRSFHHVLGNHDTYSLPKDQILTITGQPRYNAIETEEALLVFLDTTKEMNWEHWGGDMDARQLEWLENQVRRSGSKPLFIFGHHPVYNTTTRSQMEKLSIDPYIDMRFILGQKEELGLYFNGHNHVHSIVHQDQWHYIQTAACLDQPCFRLVEIDEREVRIQLIPVEDTDVLNSAQVIHDEMPYFRHTPDAQGKETDRSYTIALPSKIFSK